jgi:sigma-B regulation protein RsbU (phosphoserine phosphatase)
MPGTSVGALSSIPLRSGMTKRLLVLLVLSACILIYRGADLVQSLNGVPEVAGFGRVDLRQGRMVVVAVPPEDLDGRPSTAALIGLKPGDAVIAFEHPDGSRVSVTGLNVVGQALKELPRAGGGAIIVARQGGSAAREVRLPVPARRGSGPIAAATRIALNVLLPLLAVATALLIGFLRPDDSRAFLAGLLFLCFSALFGMYYWTLPPGIRELAAVVHTGLSILFSYTFMRFFLVFPTPGLIDRRLPWLKHVMLVPVLCLAALSIAISLQAGVSLTAAERLEAVLRLRGVDIAYIILILGMLLLGLISGVWRAFAAPTPDERRRLGILIAGAAAGLLPMMAIIVYVSATGATSLAVWMAPIVVVTLPIFPLSFIYVVVRHRVLGVSVAIRRGLQYALVSRGFLLAEGLAVFLALYLAIGPLIVRAFPEAGAGGVATTNAVAAAGVVIGLGHVNRRVKTLLDRRFFREPYNAQQVLGDLGASLQEAATDSGRLATALAGSLARALHAAYAEVYLDSTAVNYTPLPGAASPGEAARRMSCAARVVLDPQTGSAAGAQAVVPTPSLDPTALLDRWAGNGDGAAVVELDSPTDLRGIARHLKGAQRPGRMREDLVRAGLERASVAAALTVRGTRLGWLVLGDRLSEEAYSVEDRELVRAAAQQAAVALDYTKLIGRVAEQEALKRELDIARDVQAGLLPQKRPPIAGLDYDGTCRMAREVGGDYFDFLDLGAGRLGLALGDISGKGVSAALLMASLQAFLRSRARQCVDQPALLVRQVNESLVESTDPSKFATFFYAVYDSAARTLTYVNAGHNPPFLLRAGTSVVSRLRPTGMALGFDERAVYSDGNEALASGDLLLAFTDGLTEALNEAGEEFGEARLAGLLVGNRHLSASELQRRIDAELEAFCGRAPQYDDVTIVVARVI